MCEIIAVINQKGGVGKTTATAAIATGLRIVRNRAVLAIDTDPQTNLSHTFRADREAAGILDIFRGTPAEKAIQHTENGDIIASCYALANQKISGKAVLRDSLAPLRSEYDYIIIDTPPSLGKITVNVLSAADSVIIPALEDVYSIEGIYQLFDALDGMSDSINVRGVVFTRHNARPAINRDAAAMIGRIAAEHNTKIFNARIRECAALKEAQATRISIFDYAPRSNAAIDYAELLAELEIDSGRDNNG